MSKPVLYILVTNNLKDYLIRPESYRYFFEVRGYKVEALGFKSFIEEVKTLLNP